MGSGGLGFGFGLRVGGRRGAGPASIKQPWRQASPPSSPSPSRWVQAADGPADGVNKPLLVSHKMLEIPSRNKAGLDGTGEAIARDPEQLD